MIEVNESAVEAQQEGQKNNDSLPQEKMQKLISAINKKIYLIEEIQLKTPYLKDQFTMRGYRSVGVFGGVISTTKGGAKSFVLNPAQNGTAGTESIVLTNKNCRFVSEGKGQKLKGDGGQIYLIATSEGEARAEVVDHNILMREKLRNIISATESLAVEIEEAIRADRQ